MDRLKKDEKALQSIREALDRSDALVDQSVMFPMRMHAKGTA
jgi:hypothetical protein